MPFTNQDNAVCCIVAAHYINAGYYTSANENLARFANIVGLISLDAMEHLTGVLVKTIEFALHPRDASPHRLSNIKTIRRINPINFRLCELALFVGPFWENYEHNPADPNVPYKVKSYTPTQNPDDIRRVPAFLHDVPWTFIKSYCWDILFRNHPLADGFNYTGGIGAEDFQPTWHDHPIPIPLHEDLGGSSDFSEYDFYESSDSDWD